MEIVLVVMVVFSVVVVTWLTLAQSGDPPAPGTVAPEFRLPGPEGREVSLAALQGSPALIVFHPQDETPECLAVVERLNASVPAIESAGASLVTVVVSGPEAAAAYAAAHGPALRVCCDGNGRTAKAYGSLVNLGFMKFARKLIVLVDARGKIQRTWRDAVGPQQVDEALKALSVPAR
jgi:thioredoxin-dependent peroxiredoxin